MRTRLLAVAATLALSGAAARSQEPARPAAELPPSGYDPFRAPFFSPLGQSEAAPGPGGAVTLGGATRANDPRGAAAPAGAACPGDPGFKTWMSAELLIGRTRGPGVVPVVTTGPAQSGALAGAVGQPLTLPLFGGTRVLDDWRGGLRVEAGLWLDDERTLGAGARFYSLFSASEQFRAAPTGLAVVNVPQFVSAGGAAAQVPAFVGFPGAVGGRVGASANTTFAGGDLNLRLALARDDAGRARAELLAGYRQLYLSDGLGLSFATVPAPPAALGGSDAVRSRNTFYGPQLGACASTPGETVWLDGLAAAALGATVNTLEFSRERTLTTAAGGQPLIGSNVSSGAAYFGVVAEGGVRFNWQAADHLRLTAGYGFLYWNNVRRAQEAYGGGPALRAPAADFTTHLFSLGLDVRF